jgi:hypothetical protein
MSSIMEAAPEFRVCKKGCQGDTPQPIANFYKNNNGATGVQLYQYTCKKCISARENARYHRKSVEERRRARLGPAKEKGDWLTLADRIPCKACGLRGHVAGDVERCHLARPLDTRIGSRGPDWGLT